MNGLASRIRRIEAAEGPTTGRIVAVWATDKDDLAELVRHKRATGEIGASDTVVVTLWGIAESDRPDIHRGIAQ